MTRQRQAPEYALPPLHASCVPSQPLPHASHVLSPPVLPHIPVLPRSFTTLNLPGPSGPRSRTQRGPAPVHEYARRPFVGANPIAEHLKDFREESIFISTRIARSAHAEDFNVPTRQIPAPDAQSASGVRQTPPDPDPDAMDLDDLELAYPEVTAFRISHISILTGFSGRNRCGTASEFISHDRVCERSIQIIRRAR